MGDSKIASSLELRDYAFSKKGKRQNRLLFLLLKNNSMSIKELALELGYSESTIRNDLRELDQMKLIKRVVGGAASLDDTYGTIPMSEHLEHAHLEKKAIATYAFDNVIEPGMSIVLDMGSTCLALAKKISNIKYDINVVTNSLLNALAVFKNPHVYLTIPGGVYNMTVDTLDSAQTLDYYDSINPDLYFMSANGIGLHGVTITMTSDSSRALVKQKIVQNSSSVVLLCDHNKINKKCFYKVCDISDIDLLITDSLGSISEESAFRELGVDVVFAPVSEHPNDLNTNSGE